MLTLPELQKNFFKAFDDYEAASEDSNLELLKNFLLATYEYCRHKHIANISNDLNDQQKENLHQKFPNILSKFKNGNIFMDLSFTLAEKDIFDYLKFRSGVEFLYENFISYIDDPSQFNFYSLQDGFDCREYFLTYNYQDDFKNPYPTDPIPEHDGVPESHWWWKKAETHRIR